MRLPFESTTTITEEVDREAPGGIEVGLVAAVVGSDPSGFSVKNIVERGSVVVGELAGVLAVVDPVGALSEVDSAGTLTTVDVAGALAEVNVVGPLANVDVTVLKVLIATPLRSTTATTSIATDADTTVRIPWIVVVTGTTVVVVDVLVERLD